MKTIDLTMTEHEAAYIHWILYTRVVGAGEARDNINSVTDALSPIASPWSKNSAMSYSRLDAELINVENWGLERQGQHFCACSYPSSRPIRMSRGRMRPKNWDWSLDWAASF